MQKASAAVNGGVNVVQLRERNLPGGRLLALSRRLRLATQGKALLMVNDRVDVALACGADGVQLGEEALPVAEVRRLAGHDLIIGRSVHGVESAVDAEQQGADFLIVGTIFRTISKPEVDPAGLTLLQEVGRHVHIPYLAIGGVTDENVTAVVEAGAAGAAATGALLEAIDPEAAANSLRGELERTWGRRVRAKVVGQR